MIMLGTYHELCDQSLTSCRTSLKGADPLEASLFYVDRFNPAGAAGGVEVAGCVGSLATTLGALTLPPP
jgi:hypothetical protein